MYRILKQEGSAKRGELETVHGTVQTPVFMNVGTVAAIKGAVSTEDLEGIGTQIELSNTYHLHLRPTDTVVRQMGGLHKFMTWDGPILTDSGGFQVFSLASLRKIKEEGVYFASHIDGHKIFMGPEESMRIQSNLGSDIILNDLEQRRAQGSNELSEDAKHQIDLLLKSKFRPEFLNRLDEIVYYKSLTKDEMRKIVDLQLQDLRNRMEEGKHLKLEVTTAAKDFIIDSAYDSVYGARPIKRFIQSRVETLIAKAIIKGSYAEGNTLTVDYDGSALVLR